MKINSKPVGSMTAVGVLPSELMFVSDSQDVAPIKEHIGESAAEYDAFFVLAENGDYSEVWGIVGIVPRTAKLATRLL
jgi:hypothetical protein